jgi:hypothetical protein
LGFVCSLAQSYQDFSSEVLIRISFNIIYGSRNFSS